MIFSPKSGGTYIVEFRALGGESWLSACGSVMRAVQDWCELTSRARINLFRWRALNRNDMGPAVARRKRWARLNPAGVSRIHEDDEAPKVQL
jgi:hypothetical protein